MMGLFKQSEMWKGIEEWQDMKTNAPKSQTYENA